MKSIILIAALLFCSVQFFGQTKTIAPNSSPTVAEAEKFVADAEKQLSVLWIKASRAGWVQSNFITYDTETIAAEVNDELTALATRLAEEANRFDKLSLPAETARKLKLLKLSLTLPAPNNPAEREEMTKLSVALESDYGKGKYCPERLQGKCLSLNDLERILATSRDSEELKDAWLGWHAVSPRFRHPPT